MWNWFFNLFRRKKPERIEPVVPSVSPRVAQRLADRQERNLSAATPTLPLDTKNPTFEMLEKQRRYREQLREENRRREQQYWRDGGSERRRSGAGSTSGDVRGPRGNTDLHSSTPTHQDNTLTNVLLMNMVLNSGDDVRRSEPEPSRCEPTRNYDPEPTRYDPPSSSDYSINDTSSDGGGCD